jgi:hypothetical protein
LSDVSEYDQFLFSTLSVFIVRIGLYEFEWSPLSPGRSLRDIVVSVESVWKDCAKISRLSSTARKVGKDRDAVFVDTKYLAHPIYDVSMWTDEVT